MSWHFKRFLLSENILYKNLKKNTFLIFFFFFFFFFFFPETYNDAADLVTADDAEIVKGFKEKVDGITEVLARDHMKVAFFGRYISILFTSS